VQAAGGRVIGRSRHPLDAGNFGEFLTAAQDSGAKVIALASAGGDTINAVKQAAEIGISPRSQTLVPLVVLISDVHSLGLDIAKGMTFVEGFYWDADSRTPRMVKAVLCPAQCHADDGARRRLLGRHTLSPSGSGSRNRRRENSCDENAAIRVEDFFARGGELRADGRLVHDMYLVQVKPPEESRQPWDYYKVLSIIPGDKAFRPLAEGQCILART